MSQQCIIYTLTCFDIYTSWSGEFTSAPR